MDSAFNAMLQDNQGALERLARRYAGPEDWRDLVQEMHLQLWRSFDSFDGRAQQSTWVYRVVLNTALSHVRKPRREHLPLEAAPEAGCTGASATRRSPRHACSNRPGSGMSPRRWWAWLG